MFVYDGILTAEGARTLHMPELAGCPVTYTERTDQRGMVFADEITYDTFGRGRQRLGGTLTIGASGIVPVPQTRRRLELPMVGEGLLRAILARNKSRKDLAERWLRTGETHSTAIRRLAEGLLMCAVESDALIKQIMRITDVVVTVPTRSNQAEREWDNIEL